jgi:Tfp pilus assembly protein PilO
MTRRTIILIVIAVVVGFYVFYVDDLAEKRPALQEKLEMDFTTLMKHEKFIQRTKMAGVDIEDALEELAEKEKHIIHTTDQSLAFARLQKKIQDLAYETGLRISTIKLLPAVAHNGYTELPIFMDSTGDISNLSEFLKHIDSGKDFIGLDELDISSAPKGRLRVKMQLSGLMKT